MPLRKIAVALAICVFAIAADAQTQQTCITPPADSPILAPTLDTIPPGTFTILTHTGARAEVTANGRMAVVEMNDNEQRVWWGPDTAPGTGRVYYNRRYRADATSPWYWQYSKSILIISLGNTSAGPNSVLYSPTPKYRNRSNSNYYKYIMYAISQPSACDGVSAGILFVSYSNDGVCWTPLAAARRYDGPSVPCAGLHETVPVETIAAIDAGSSIYFLEMEGDLGPLADPTQMNRTAAYLSTATLGSPGLLTKLDYSDVTVGGIVSPESPDTSTNTYAPYNYLMNLDMAYDPTNGTIYMGRAYPFPFDRDQGYWNMPCRWQAEDIGMWDSVRQTDSPVEGCRPSPYTLPNRVQIYKKHIGALSNITNLYGGSWTLVSDLGGDVGYSSSAIGSCANTTTPPYTPRSDPRQQDAGRDYAYVNFVRDPSGNLKLYNGVPYILAGDSFKKSKSRGECYITGQERETLVSFPR